MNSKISKITQEIIELHSKKLTNIEISKKLNLPIKKIMGDLNRHGYKSNRYLNIEQTEELKQFILGSILGDGYLTKIEDLAINSRLSLGHGIKQKQYCEYKHKFLDKYKLSGKMRYYKAIDSRFKSGYSEGYFFRTKSHPLFSYYRSKFYIDNIKIINKEIISEIGPLGLAIWFMDDASLATRSYQIHTTNFKKEECLYLIEILKSKFDIDCTLQKDNVIYIRTKSIQKFNSLIEPYIIDSMRYKIKRVLNKSGELREKLEIVNPEPSISLKD